MGDFNNHLSIIDHFDDFMAPLAIVLLSTILRKLRETSGNIQPPTIIPEGGTSMQF